MSTPLPGARVRLAALRGVASPAMRAAVGKVGKVVATRTQQGGSVLVEARFPGGADGADDVFWLKPGEFELLDEPGEPVQPSPTKPVQEQAVVADFRTAVQTRIDQLSSADADLARQAEEIAAQRATNLRERKALEAAVGAYERVRDGVSGPRALPAPRRVGSVTGRVFLAEWATQHGGVVVTAQALPAAVDAGISPHAVKKAVLERSDFERLERGVYRFRQQIAS